MGIIVVTPKIRADEQVPPSADQSAKIAALEAALAERDATILRQVQIIAYAHDKRRQTVAAKKITALCIEKLELRVHKFLRKRFGSSSEQLDQLRLGIEDLEADQSERAKGEPEEAPAADVAKAAKPRDRKLSDKLKRRTVVREPKSASCCPDCGGGLRLVGEDSDEMLDLVTQVCEVLQPVRPKYSCRTCDRIVQAAPPPKPIAKGKLTSPRSRTSLSPSGAIICLSTANRR